MLDFKFLNSEQVLGEKRLEIFEKYGTDTEVTDFSILLGVNYVSCSWWVDGIDDETGKVLLDYGYATPLVRHIGARPSFDAFLNIFKSKKLNSSKEILKISFGEYPQTIVDAETSKILTEQHYKGLLKETGKVYTTDSVYFENWSKCFRKRNHVEYEFQGNKYIGFVGDKNCEGLELSDGREIVEREIYWVRVEPIVWLVDSITNIAVSEKILFSGVQFCSTEKYDGDFYNTNIKWFMDNYFSKEIISSKDDILDDNLSQNSTTQNNNLQVSSNGVKLKNPYNFDLGEVSEDEIIEGCIQSGVPVFLHGPSSEGKSARVKQIDPKLVKLTLAGITPEKLNGRSVYNSLKDMMEDKKPTWLERLEEICTLEPDKNHILFLDELSNALPSIQGMVYHLVLDREVNDRWCLPDNARIVLAGNEMKDSLAANRIVEPLFNRCAHVYVKTDLVNWLIWAGKNKIHPSICSFMIYTKGKALRSEYDGEKPNADPRKWEMASKVLYSTKNPEMIRSLVGEEIAREFCDFCNQKVISLNDIINGNYDNNYLSKLSISEKYATVVGLSSVNKDNIEVVRSFVSELGEEFLIAFDYLFGFDSEENLEILAEMKMNQRVKKL